MTVPVRPVRRTYRERGFDLRTTALYFLLLAIILCAVVFLARTAAGMVEQRPVWAGVLAVTALATVWWRRSRRRGISVAGYARRAARTLEEAAEKASDSLDARPAGTEVPVAVRIDAPAEVPADTAPVHPAPVPRAVPAVITGTATEALPSPSGGEESTVLLAHTEPDPGASGTPWRT
ncbi:hypothetical protein [Streptomyces ziwulingensis]|uniref:Uncharacterized protein n=1 Tax=Streptomyces ziwulingensis TaxID=1045501 RepID=A0ABP9C5U9_9ACTN